MNVKELKEALKKYESDYLSRKSASEKHLEEFVRMYPDRKPFIERRYYEK